MKLKSFITLDSNSHSLSYRNYVFSHVLRNLEVGSELARTLGEDLNIFFCLRALTVPRIHSRENKEYRSIEVH